VLKPAELDRLCVVLVATRNPLNMGAAARAMSNFGFSDMRVVRPWEAAFREARSAVGALDLLANAREYDSVAEAVADCSLVVGTSAGSRKRDAQHDIHRLESGASIIQQTLRGNRSAILFGSEKFGLSNDDLSHCDWLLNIPAREEHSSMNLGQAVAVCLYELIRDTAAPVPVGPFPTESASAGQSELLTTVALEVLADSGYLERHPRGNMQAELRRIIHRLQPNAKDAEAALGMMRQALWKLRSLKS
jgi:TrmH family RNA methyltransferase